MAIGICLNILIGFNMFITVTLIEFLKGTYGTLTHDQDNLCVFGLVLCGTLLVINMRALYDWLMGNAK